MSLWIPKRNPNWEGQEAFIIGGGPSLSQGFDFNLLANELTIGCNDAYQKGSAVCKICVFGDAKWWKTHKDRLIQYPGLVVTNVPHLHQKNVKWLYVTDRQQWGLSKTGLAWNGNTGSPAINLALLLGAVKVYLLGFDFKLNEDGESNWHPNNIDKPNAEIYKGKFQEGFVALAKALPIVFPGQEVFNVTNDSDLDVFPKINLNDFWKDRKNGLCE